MKCDKHTMLLYAVTDRAWVGEQTLYQQVESALKGGATCVQLREKQLGDADFLQEAIQIHALCQQYGVPLFINDNVEVALQCHAEGIHVGQDDMAARTGASARGRRCNDRRIRSHGAGSAGRCGARRGLSGRRRGYLPPTPRRT